jgi:Domain of unknown function (DUF1905)
MTDIVRFRAVVEPWKPSATGGLMIALVPDEQARQLGGLKQLRVVGTMNGVEFTSNTMPRGGGRLALSVSRAMMKAAGVEFGGEVDVEMHRAAR